MRNSQRNLPEVGVDWDEIWAGTFEDKKTMICEKQKVEVHLIPIKIHKFPDKLTTEY